MFTSRRSLIGGGVAAAALSFLPVAVRAQNTTQTPARFNPKPGTWSSFEVTTRVDLTVVDGRSQVWMPIPGLQTTWQSTQASRFSSNGNSRLMAAGVDDVRLLHTEFSPDVEKPFVELTSWVRTQNRSENLEAAAKGLNAGSLESEEPSALAYYTRATRLLPTDGIVAKTAQDITQGARSDVEKVKAIYSWLVANSWRDPKVRGCGNGDIKTMLETGNLGGKCADVNALFVGLCRASGVPARDVYGIRLKPSAFGYKQLSGNPARLQGAQHCRAEVYLQNRGWVAMDPADVTKVMRYESDHWIKNTDDPVVQPVYQALRGGWEGNWLGWNTAHDVELPGSKEGVLSFFMYPVAENDAGRLDSYAPDTFQYRITAREI